MILEFFLDWFRFFLGGWGSNICQVWTYCIARRNLRIEDIS